MYDRLIVASGNRDLRRFWRDIGDILREKLAPKSDVESCRDAEDVERLLRPNRPRRDLIIVDQTLPASDDPEAKQSVLGGGFDLVKRLQGQDPAPACILVGLSDNRVARAAVEWPLCVMLTYDVPQQSDMVDDFRTLADGLARKRDRMMARQIPSPQPTSLRTKPWALLDINLDGSYLWLQIGEGRRISFSEHNPLQLYPVHARTRKSESDKAALMLKFSASVFRVLA